MHFLTRFCFDSLDFLMIRLFLFDMILLSRIILVYHRCLDETIVPLYIVLIFNFLCCHFIHLNCLTLAIIESVLAFYLPQMSFARWSFPFK
jgi:hypothetical protein